MQERKKKNTRLLLYNAVQYSTMRIKLTWGPRNKSNTHPGGHVVPKNLDRNGPKVDASLPLSVPNIVTLSSSYGNMTL